MLVLGIGLGIGFFLTHLHSPSAPPLPGTTDLAPVPITSAWQSMIHAGQPPSDVLENMVVPGRATVSGFHNRDQGVGQYDRGVDFLVAAAPTDVEGFYGAELRAVGWRIRAVAYTADRLGRQILAYRFSRDSYEWDAKIEVDPVSGRNSAGSAAGTRLSVEIYQVSDDEG